MGAPRHPRNRTAAWRLLARIEARPPPVRVGRAGGSIAFALRMALMPAACQTVSVKMVTLPK